MALFLPGPLRTRLGLLFEIAIDRVTGAKTDSFYQRSQKAV